MRLPWAYQAETGAFYQPASRQVRVLADYIVANERQVQYFERLKLMSNCCNTNKDGSDDLHGIYTMQRNNDDYTNLFTHIPEVYLNMNIKKRKNKVQNKQ